ncbi:transposable element Tcb2 transposase [Trichonephila clavipes]|nr:transposable element Tcb2 transposase [Trichonephila clavipes]
MVQNYEWTLVFWIHPYDSENKKQSVEYRHPGSPNVKKFETSMSATKTRKFIAKKGSRSIHHVMPREKEETITVMACCNTEDKSRFNLWDHEGLIRVRRYAGESCLPECVIERHSGLTPGVMAWGAISYHGRSNLLRIEAIFQLDNACSRVTKTVRDFCSAQYMQLLPWIAYSPDMSPIEPVWDLVGRCLARDLRPGASKDELLLRIKKIGNFLPQVDIQNLFDSMPLRIAALILA